MGFRILTYEFWGAMNIQSITEVNLFTAILTLAFIKKLPSDLKSILTYKILQLGSRSSPCLSLLETLQLPLLWDEALHLHLFRLLPLCL